MPVVKDHPQSPTAQHEECSHRDKRVKTLANNSACSELTNSSGTDSTKTANLGQDQMGPASFQVAAAGRDESLRYYIMPGDSTDATSAECTSASDSATRDGSGGNDDSMEEDTFKTFNFLGLPKEVRDKVCYPHASSNSRYKSVLNLAIDLAAMPAAARPALSGGLLLPLRE